MINCVKTTSLKLKMRKKKMIHMLKKKLNFKICRLIFLKPTKHKKILVVENFI